MLRETSFIASYQSTSNITSQPTPKIYCTTHTPLIHIKIFTHEYYIHAQMYAPTASSYLCVFASGFRRDFD